MFFGQLDKHITKNTFQKKYIFVDENNEELPADYQVVYFDKNKKYQEQFSSCIKSVLEEYCIYISEDYILYDNIRCDLIKEYKNILDNNQNISFVRFMRGGTVDLMHPYENCKRIYKLYNYLPYFYTNQVALWRTRDLEKIHVCGPNLHIGNTDYENSFEYRATQTCEELGIEGVFYHNNEPKRGLYHYDTEIFPHVSTALVKGKWNLSEYPEELTPLLKKYNIDFNDRGWI